MIVSVGEKRPAGRESRNFEILLSTSLGLPIKIMMIMSFKGKSRLMLITLIFLWW